MKAYIYHAALYCETCGQRIRDSLTAAGKAPADPDNEHTYDSHDFPKGPFADGGGDADCPQHCDECQQFLGNPLTQDGYKYVLEKLQDYVGDQDGNAVVLDQWESHIRPGVYDTRDRFVLAAYRKVRELEQAMSDRINTTIPG